MVHTNLRAVTPRSTRRSDTGEHRPPPIPYTEFGHAGEVLVFLHANGYPPGCYKLLLEKLSSRYTVKAMIQRPLWPESDPRELHSWHVLSEDLLRFVRDCCPGPVSVVGHSMGAIAALRAAMEDPAAFRSLVLVDPVLAGPSEIFTWRVFRHAPAGHHLHTMIRGAQKRRQTFENFEAAFQAYRARRVFRHLSGAALRALISGLFKPGRDGDIELVYRREWEARIYQTAIWNDGDLLRGIRSLEVPTMVIRGVESEALADGVIRLVRNANSGITVRTVDKASHLVALEHPNEVGQLIEDFLSASVPHLMQPA